MGPHTGVEAAEGVGLASCRGWEESTESYACVHTHQARLEDAADQVELSVSLVLRYVAIDDVALQQHR